MILEIFTFGWLDKLLKHFFRINAAEEANFHSRRATIRDDIRLSILHDMEIIDSKSSALLTHISILLVVLLFLFDEKNHIILNIFVFFELTIYILMAALLLRCVEIMGPPFRQFSNEKKLNESMYYEEIAFRRAIYVRVVRIVFILTLFLLPTAFFKFALPFFGGSS